MVELKFSSTTKKKEGSVGSYFGSFKATEDIQGFGNNPIFGNIRPDSDVMFKGRIDNSKSVKLYLISPYRRDSAVIRPLLWSGDDGVFNDVAHLMESRRNEFVSSMGGNIKNGFFLDRSHASHTAIMPSNEFMEYKSNILDDHGWRFILFVDNDKTIGSRSVQGRRNRTIYTGFCIGDAPVVQKFGRDIIDEHAQFYITHKTVVEIDERINSYGKTEIASIPNNVDVMPSALMEINVSDGSDKRDYILDPGEIMKSSVFMADVDGTDVVKTESPSFASISARNNVSFNEAAIMNSPKHHVNKVMSSLFRTLEHTENDKMFSRRSGYVSSITDSYSAEQAFASYLQGGVPDAVRGINTKEPYFEFRDIINRYPDVARNIEILYAPRDMEGDLLGASEIEKAPSLLSTLSSLIKSAVPPIMHECGIALITFRWASSPADGYGTIRLNKEPVVKFYYDARPIVPEPSNITERRVREVISQLERHVFTTVENVAGDFEVLIHYSSGMKTVVQLQLRELTSEINNGYAISQDDLGGLISPLVGTEKDYSAHTQTIQSLLHVTTGLSENPSEFNIASENNFGYFEPQGFGNRFSDEQVGGPL